MNLKQFSDLLAAYGAEETRWPAEIRDEAIRYRREQPEAIELVHDAQALDAALQRYEAKDDVSRLQSRILRQVQESSAEPDIVDRIWNWLVPERAALGTLWRPALVATLPLLIGVVLGGSLPEPADPLNDSWDDEIYLLALGEEEPQQ